MSETQIKRAVIMVGTPASGKSCVARKISEALGLKIISADENLPRDEAGNRIHNRDTLRAAWLRVWKDAGNCVLEGRGFILDTTLVTEINRSPVIGLSLGAGFEVTAVFMNTRPETCLLRNSTREDRIPESALLRMAANLEFPRMEEGWTTIYRIDSSSDLTYWRYDSEEVLDPELHETVVSASLGGEASRV